VPVVLVVFVAFNDVLARNIGMLYGRRFSRRFSLRLLRFSRCRFAGIAILQETIVDSILDLLVGLAAGFHFDVKKHSDVHGCKNGILHPFVLIVALRLLCRLHSGFVFLESHDLAINPIHDLDKLFLCIILNSAGRWVAFIGLHEEGASEFPELINLALVSLNPVQVEFSDLGRVHGLTQLHVSHLDLSNFFSGAVFLITEHIIDGGIADFRELIDSPFSILKSSHRCIQPFVLQIDSVCLGK
jgi:hypothetical protein